MSSLFNQTNIAPGTPFASGGGGSNFQSGILIGSNGANINLISAVPNANWGSPSLIVTDASTTNNNPLCASLLFAAGGSGNFYKTGNLGSNGIYFRGNLGTGKQSDFINVLDSAINNSPTDLAFQMSCVSSIQCGSFILNAEKMCSTMVGYGWA